jgi:bifunctional DNA-binding transcriptional regulator/antitoxin component of YhaV-PrlF toxin-antitoxin module
MSVNRTSEKPSIMSKVQLHYDGWVTLPAAALKRLGLSTGDRLELEVINDAIVLHRAQKSSASERATMEPVLEAAQFPVATPEPVVKRGPGRPRKAPVAAVPPTLKTRGRRKAVTAVEAPAH